jgi:hypothetical protein
MDEVANLMNGQYLLSPNGKGALGQLAVAKDLVRQGIYVYVEVGSNSKVDMVVLTEGHNPYRVQVKTATYHNGVVHLYVRKCCLNPKYNSVYSVTDVDLFALYVEDMDIVLYIPASEALKCRNRFSIRFMEPKNRQGNFNAADKYRNLKGLLRDCTPNNRQVAADHKVDDTVQTTNPAMDAGESRCGR